MFKKIITIVVVIIIILAIWLFIRFVIGGPEDDWICVDGEWIKHGVPSAPIPITGCGDEDFLNCLNDSDCVVFGQDGDCNCGCFNKNYDWQNTGACFCAAPTSCKCVNNKCEGVFEGEVMDFWECLAAGNPVMESYPRQCRDEHGNLYIEDIGNPDNSGEKIDLIQITNPRPNQKITSPLVIQGQARGYWFFEADFPVKLYDANGNLLVVGIAYAQGPWMTEDFVNFKAEIDFSQPSTKRGILILQKDNASGLPENYDELRVPVEF